MKTNEIVEKKGIQKSTIPVLSKQANPPSSSACRLQPRFPNEAHQLTEDICMVSHYVPVVSEQIEAETQQRLGPIMPKTTKTDSKAFKAYPIMWIIMGTLAVVLIVSFLRDSAFSVSWHPWISLESKDIHGHSWTPMDIHGFQGIRMVNQGSKTGW